MIKLVSNHNKLAVTEPQTLFKRTAKHLISLQPESVDKSNRIFIKEYRYSFGNRVLSMFGMHPGKRSWFSANGLLVRHTFTAEPIALIEQIDPFYTWVKRSYFITRETKVEPTNDYVVRNFVSRIKNKKSLECKIAFIKEFAFAIRRLHQRGIFHYDLKSNNILIKEYITGHLDNYSRNWHFYSIDLDRLKFSPEIFIQERFKNLSQLNASVSEVMTRADRLRFYRFYSGGEKDLPRTDEKAIIKQIMALTIKRHHFWPQQF
jgi:serine/threonine protein kinase